MCFMHQEFVLFIAQYIFLEQYAPIYLSLLNWWNIWVVPSFWYYEQSHCKHSQTDLLCIYFIFLLGKYLRIFNVDCTIAFLSTVQESSGRSAYFETFGIVNF